MGGFLGLGGSGAHTDRGQNLAATQGAWNIFNQSLPTGIDQQKTGTTDLSTAKSTLQNPSEYWQRLLSGGRTDTAQLSAPAINSTLAASDATKAASSQFGSGRSGGDVAQKREAQTQTDSQVNDIINANLVGGRAAGATGLEKIAGEQASIGSVELQNALANLGLSSAQIQNIMKNSSDNFQFNTNNEMSTAASAAGAAVKLAPIVAGWFGL